MDSRLYIQGKWGQRDCLREISDIQSAEELSSLTYHQMSADFPDMPVNSFSSVIVHCGPLKQKFSKGDGGGGGRNKKPKNIEMERQAGCGGGDGSLVTADSPEAWLSACWASG